MTAVCFGRGSCRGQCKDVTPERARAAGRGETRDECGELGGRRAAAAAQPGQSRPVTAILPGTPALTPATTEGREGRPARRPGNEGRGRRGLPGPAGLEVASASSQGPQRMWQGDGEGRSGTDSTWRSLAAPSSCMPLAGGPSPHVLGRWGLQAGGGRVGWSWARQACSPEPQNQTAVFSSAMWAPGWVSPAAD